MYFEIDRPDHENSATVSDLLTEIERVKDIRTLYRQLGGMNGIDLRRALFDMTEAIEGAEMAIEQGNLARIMDAMRDMRSYQP